MAVSGLIYVSNENSANERLEVKPFHLYWNRKDLHLDPVHALLQWLHEARVQSGYLFRRITVHDQVSQENRPLVSKIRKRRKIKLSSDSNMNRVASNSWRHFDTICSILALIQLPMAHTLFVVAAASILQLKNGGQYENCVTGVDGAWRSIILPL